MRKIRYLAMMLLSLCSITMLAQIGSGYNPDSPNEPPAPNIPRYSQLTLVADPVGGGNPTTSGKMAIGSTVNLNANKASGFRFINWTNAAGDVISENENIQITKGEADETFTAHYVYEPASPNEPTDPYLQLKVQLNAVAAEGGSVSGGGKYLPGTNVTLNASPAGNYVFKNWTDENGNVVSTTAQFSYTVKTVVETLTANFTFIPSSPNEPNAPDIAIKHHVFIVGGEGGTVSASQFAVEGSNVSVSANCNSGYEFLGWFKDGLLVNSNSSFTYTVTAEDVTFEARFNFNPASPNEPTTPNNAMKYIFYIENANSFQGENMVMSIFLSSLNEIGDLTFQLSFPENLVPEESGITYLDRLSSYTKTCTYINSNTLKFEFTGGELPSGNGALVTFTIPVPEDFPTGTRNPVRMNQISFVEVGGSSTTTNARNANLGVYKYGDVNGDNVIDVADVHGVMLYMRSMIDVTDGFIIEAADISKNGNISQEDLVAIIALANENSVDVTPSETGNSLYVTPFSTFAGAKANDDKWFSVGLTNNLDVWGVQFDMLLPEGMALAEPVAANNADRLGSDASMFKVSCTTLDNGWMRVFVIPANVEQFITGFEGEIFKMHYTTADNMATGTHTITLRNIKLSLQRLDLDCLSGTTATVDVHKHVNDGGSCSICGELLSYTRTVAPDEMGTICLPKGAEEGDFSGATFYRVLGKRIDGDGNPSFVVIEEVTTLEAGVPYIFIATGTLMEITYSGATVDEAQTVNGLVGSLTGCDVDEGMYVLYNNYVAKCGADCSIAANRAYICMESVPDYSDTPSSSAKIRFLNIGMPTGITAVTTNPQSQYYNLSGIRTAVSVKGIIIVNGKKVINHR